EEDGVAGAIDDLAKQHSLVEGIIQVESPRSRGDVRPHAGSIIPQGAGDLLPMSIAVVVYWIADNRKGQQIAPDAQRRRSRWRAPGRAEVDSQVKLTHGRILIVVPFAKLPFLVSAHLFQIGQNINRPGSSAARFQVLVIVVLVLAHDAA